MSPPSRPLPSRCRFPKTASQRSMQAQTCDFWASGPWTKYSLYTFLPFPSYVWLLKDLASRTPMPRNVFGCWRVWTAPELLCGPGSTYHLECKGAVQGYSMTTDGSCVPPGVRIGDQDPVNCKQGVPALPPRWRQVSLDLQGLCGRHILPLL